MMETRMLMFLSFSYSSYFPYKQPYTFQEELLRHLIINWKVYLHSMKELLLNSLLNKHPNIEIVNLHLKCVWKRNVSQKSFEGCLPILHFHFQLTQIEGKSIFRYFFNLKDCCSGIKNTSRMDNYNWDQRGIELRRI